MPPSTINKAATKLISLQGTKRPRNNLSAKSFSAMAHSVRNGLPLCNTLLEALCFLTRKLVREGSGQPRYQPRQSTAQAPPTTASGYASGCFSSKPLR